MINPFISLAIIASFLSFAFFYVVPLYGEVEAQKADLGVLNDAVEDTEKIKEVIGQTVKSLDSVDPLMMKRLETFLPKTIDEVRVANNIQGVGVKNGLAVSNVKISNNVKGVQGGGTEQSVAGAQVEPVLSQGIPQEQKEKYATTKITFDITTSYEGFRLFVDDLEKSLGLINIKSLAFQEYKESKIIGSKSSRGAIPNPLYTFKVEIETYSLK